MALTKVTSGLTDLDGGITIDNITIDGTEIDLSSGDLTIDVAGDIILDADGGDILLKDAGTDIGKIQLDTAGLILDTVVSDKDFFVNGNDGGSAITALRLDMSAAGRATFNGDLIVPRYIEHTGDSDTFIGFPSDDTFVINTAGSERMRIDSSGSVMVGTTASNLSEKGFVLSNAGINMYQIQTGTASSTYHVYDTTGGNYKFYVTYTGVINATTTTISAISDERLKENIRDLDKGLNDILKLKPRRFDWKTGEGSDTKDVSGFVAQECEEAGFEEFVGDYKHKELDDAKSFGQGGLIPALVKAIQEQQIQIEALQSEINTLKGG